MCNLKNLIQELEKLLHKHHGQLDTDVFCEMQFKVDQLKREIDKAGCDNRRLASDALRLLAALLSVVTNVMTFLK
jgi:hypothetical protein